MDVIITEWALQSYLELKHQRVFTKQEYQQVIRPDAELLKDGYPSPHAKFKSQKFWGPATDMSGNAIPQGFKMKWHNIGSGNVQLRLAVALVNGHAFLCRAYVKANDAVDKREMAKFKIHLRDLALNQFIFRGAL